MATRNDAINLIFAGESSSERGYFIASSVGSTSFTSGDENRNLVTSKSIFKDTFDLHYVNDDSPLEFDFILVKVDEDNRYIDANDERYLKKWLLKNKREWLFFEQDDLYDTGYFCIINTIEKVDVSTYTAAYRCHVICDSSHAWTSLKKKNYTCVDTLTFNFNSSVDYDDYILYPSLTIKPTSITAETITIKNNTTDETITLDNCIDTETIFLDCKTDKIKSSSGRIMLTDWNKKTIGFQEGNNSVSLTGNFTMEMNYRLPVRVGG